MATATNVITPDDPNNWECTVCGGIFKPSVKYRMSVDGTSCMSNCRIPTRAKKRTSRSRSPSPPPSSLSAVVAPAAAKAVPSLSAGRGRYFEFVGKTVLSIDIEDDEGGDRDEYVVRFTDGTTGEIDGVCKFDTCAPSAVHGKTVRSIEREENDSYTCYGLNFGRFGNLKDDAIGWILQDYEGNGPGRITLTGAPSRSPVAVPDDSKLFASPASSPSKPTQSTFTPEQKIAAATQLKTAISCLTPAGVKEMWPLFEARITKLTDRGLIATAPWPTTTASAAAPAAVAKQSVLAFVNTCPRAEMDEINRAIVARHNTEFKQTVAAAMSKMAVGSKVTVPRKGGGVIRATVKKMMIKNVELVLADGRSLTCTASYCTVV